MKTFTPELDPAVLARRRAYAAHFAPDFPQSKPARWAGVYLHGLLTDGERKSIEPLSRRVTRPPERANCQVAVTLHYSGPRGHFPLAVRLHLPESWTDNAERTGGAGVPEELRTHRTKRPIALERLDRVRGEGITGGTVVADAGYGNAGEPRDGLAERGLRYVVGVAPGTIVFAQQPRWTRRPRPRSGRASQLWWPAAGSPRPVAVSARAGRLPLERVAWRDRAKGRLSAQFAWVRVWVAAGYHRGVRVRPRSQWRLVEEPPDGEIKYALSNRPASAALPEVVRVWEQRWRVEQGHQQTKEELGPDHFEGRSWRGFHHHAALVILAYGFSLLEQTRTGAEPVGAGKKGAPSDR
jgi:SRSO17 transposase